MEGESPESFKDFSSVFQGLVRAFQGLFPGHLSSTTFLGLLNGLSRAFQSLFCRPPQINILGPFQRVLGPPQSRFQGLLRNFIGHFLLATSEQRFRATFRAFYVRPPHNNGLGPFWSVLWPPQSHFQGLLRNFIGHFLLATSEQRLRATSKPLLGLFMAGHLIKTVQGHFGGVLGPPQSHFQGLLRNFIGHFLPATSYKYFRATSKPLLGPATSDQCCRAILGCFRATSGPFEELNRAFFAGHLRAVLRAL